MKKLLFVLLMALSLTASAQWIATPTAAEFVEHYTGTTLTLTGTSITIHTTPQYTGIVEPTYFDVDIYDSIGHYVMSFNNELCSDPSPEVCEVLLYYTAYYCGEFYITIYGPGPDNLTYVYTIEIPTFKTQDERYHLYQRIMKRNK